MARAPALQAGGRGFEPLILHTGGQYVAARRFIDRMGERRKRGGGRRRRASERKRTHKKRTHETRHASERGARAFRTFREDKQK